MTTTSAMSDDPPIGPPISRIPVELMAKIFLCAKDGLLKRVEGHCDDSLSRFMEGPRFRFERPWQFQYGRVQSGNLSSDNVHALEFASALELVSISGLPWGAAVFLDTSSLTEFEEHWSSIEANVLDTWIALLPFANNLTSVAMWYGDILGVVYGRRSHALLSKVTSFSSGSIDVFDAMTLPKLALLSLSTISERDDPLTLTAAKRMLVCSNTSHMLRGLEIRNVPLTGDILSIFDLSPCLDQVTLECDVWTPKTDMIVRQLLTVKLAHYDMDGGLTCTPLLSRLCLTIAHQPQPFSISFYNEGLVDMMEVR
ncbi:hypothetical protein EDD85DRAFT_797967 [Armillaria nabsnona]|nr:hypothetical protein EDD85DRAFT_797967 [Armillaria nabsnona]